MEEVHAILPCHRWQQIEAVNVSAPWPAGHGVDVKMENYASRGAAVYRVEQCICSSA